MWAVIDAYVADQTAAREKYRDRPVTASGVVNWAARRDDITSRLTSLNGVALPARPVVGADDACVLITVLDRHTVTAEFAQDNSRQALALKRGDRVTVRGRHTAGWFWVPVDGEGTVGLTLADCEIVR